jgi:hypothetical protein
MARDGKNRMPQGSEEQEEMTVVILRFKGAGESLQKGFDTVGQALAMLGQPAIHQRRLAALAPAPAGTARNHEQNAADSNGGKPVGAEDVEAEFEDAVVESSEDSAQRGGSAGRKYTKPKFDSKLKLDAGAVTFKDYCGQKKPETDNDKYIIAAAWLTKYGDHPVFTAGQIFTCFRAMTWDEQKDFMQPVRLMMKNKSYFEKAGRFDWKLTQVGLEAAEAVTPKTA